MAKIHPNITSELKAFIENQHIFFTGTAMADGRVNVSPKGRDSLRVLDENTLLWRNLTGSGNETAAHLRQLNRITIMWCAFEGKPMILRCYGTAEVYHERDAEFEAFNTLFPDDPGARQIFKVHVDIVQTSCGFAVPLMEFQEERDVLSKWSESRGKDVIHTYWKERNSVSLDGVETGILND